MRALCALLGSTVIPVAYQIMIELNLSHWSSALAAVFLICGKLFFENIFHLLVTTARYLHVYQLYIIMEIHELYC